MQPQPVSSDAIPRAWRLLLYTIAILGFGSVPMCSWLSSRIKTASVVYHGFSLMIYIIFTGVYMAGFAFTGVLEYDINKLIFLVLLLCAVSMCATSFWTNVSKRSGAYLQSWVDCCVTKGKNATSTILLNASVLMIVALAMTTCYYNARVVFYFEDALRPSFFPVLNSWPRFQKVVYLVFTILSEIILLVSTLFAALAYNIIVEIYFYATELTMELQMICTQEHVSHHKLQVWRQNFRCLEKVLKCVNGYLGGTVLVLLVLSVSTLILDSFLPITNGIKDPGILLVLSVIIIIVGALTVPSAALNGKVSAYPDSKVHGANTGPIWGRQDPGGPHVGPMNFVIWVDKWATSVYRYLCNEVEGNSKHSNGDRSWSCHEI